jgi:cytochrome o ubiquinol oxidase subunit 1
MWLVAGLFFVLVLVTVVVHTFNYQRDFYIPADHVTEIENLRTLSLAAQA